LLLDARRARGGVARQSGGDHPTDDLAALRAGLQLTRTAEGRSRLVGKTVRRQAEAGAGEVNGHGADAQGAGAADERGVGAGVEEGQRGAWCVVVCYVNPLCMCVGSLT